MFDDILDRLTSDLTQILQESKVQDVLHGRSHTLPGCIAFRLSMALSAAENERDARLEAMAQSIQNEVKP